jgi:predicted Zn finger-like uncharacterized protein
MKITCPSCSARYSIDDAKVKGKAFKFTCKKCGQTHVYRGTADGSAAAVPASAPAAAPAPAAAAPPQGGEEEAVWYVAVGDEQQGPYTAQQICEYIQNDQLDPESYMWKEGMEDWLPVQQVQEFTAYYQGGGAPAEAPAPAPQQAGPFGGMPEDVTVASPFLPGSVPQQDSGDLFAFGGAGAAPKQPAAGRSADPSPFGAFGAGGGAAAVAARGGADLFGGAQASPFEGGAPEEREEDVMMGAAAAAASPRVDASKMIGQRNENSVLFSLSSLQSLAGGRTAAAAGASAHAPAHAPAAAPKAGFATGEGSGLIDIRAMAGSVAKQEEKRDDLFGFGSGGAIGAPVAVPILTRPIRHEDESRKPMYILIGVIGAFAIAIVVLVIVLFGRKEEKVVVQQVPVVAGAGDGGTTVVAASSGDGDAGTPAEEPDAAAGKTDEDKGGTGDAQPTGDVPPSDGDPNAKAADGGEGGEPTGEGPHNPGGRRDGGHRTEGQDAGSPTTNPAARDSGTAAQRDTGRLAGDLSALIAPHRDAGTGGGSDLPATPSRDDVRSKFESVRGAVKACTGNQAGTASVATTIQGSSGRVTRVNVTGDFTGPAATCISNAIRGLNFPQFSNPTLTVNYSYRF